MQQREGSVALGDESHNVHVGNSARVVQANDWRDTTRRHETVRDAGDASIVVERVTDTFNLGGKSFNLSFNYSFGDPKTVPSFSNLFSLIQRTPDAFELL